MDITTDDPPTLLHRAIAANALFSAVSGVVVTVGASAASGFVGLPSLLLIVVGLGIVGFAVVLHAALRTGITRRLGLFAVTADAAWVVAAIIVIAVPGTMSGGGKAVLGVVSAVVAAFGGVEWLALRRMRRSQ
jgi:hypothetical protein